MVLVWKDPLEEMVNKELQDVRGMVAEWLILYFHNKKYRSINYAGINCRLIYEGLLPRIILIYMVDI